MVEFKLPTDDLGRWIVALKEGQRMADPTRPGRFLHGPCVLDIERFVDGGIEVIVRDGDPYGLEE